jgi:hypothetical protein
MECSGKGGWCRVSTDEGWIFIPGYGKGGRVQGTRITRIRERHLLVDRDHAGLEGAFSTGALAPARGSKPRLLSRAAHESRARHQSFRKSAAQATTRAASGSSSYGGCLNPSSRFRQNVQWPTQAALSPIPSFTKLNSKPTGATQLKKRSAISPAHSRQSSCVLSAKNSGFRCGAWSQATTSAQAESRGVSLEAVIMGGTCNEAQNTPRQSRFSLLALHSDARNRKTRT